MPLNRCRTWCHCGNCNKRFSLGNSELKSRLKGNKSGLVFCSTKCWAEYQRNKVNAQKILSPANMASQPVRIVS